MNKNTMHVRICIFAVTNLCNSISRSRKIWSTSDCFSGNFNPKSIPNFIMPGNMMLNPTGASSLFSSIMQDEFFSMKWIPKRTKVHYYIAMATRTECKVCIIVRACICICACLFIYDFSVDTFPNVLIANVPCLQC